jgi:hypothetical protein
MRMNMGLVARRFFDRFVHADSEGIYRIGYFKREGEALKFHGEQQKTFPLEIDHGKISSGYLPLTPVNETTRYVAWSIISRKRKSS